MTEPDVQRPRLVRGPRCLMAWCAVILAAGGLIARQLPVINHAVLIAAAMSPYLLIASVAAAVLFVMDRRRWSAALALVLVAVGVAGQVPQFLGGNDDLNGTTPIRIMTANLRDGGADPEALATAAHDHADVLVLQELSPPQAQFLEERYLALEFPYQVLYPGEWAAGVGIFSRYPIVQATRINRYVLGALTATIRVPDVGSDVVVGTVHLVGPWPQSIDKWRAEIAEFPQTLRDVALQAGPGAAIVAGDLNATADLKPFRELLRTGFRAAGTQVGFAPTYPSSKWLPPLLRIDHILIHNSSASAAHAVRIAGSDHLALAATVHVPS